MLDFIRSELYILYVGRSEDSNYSLIKISE